MIELLGVLVAIIGTATVAYTDYKTGYMPDKYTHAMIALGLVLLPFYNGLSYALSQYFIAAIVFTVSFIFYIYGQLGGGDVKLFTALTLLIPVYPQILANTGFNPITAPYPFIVSVFFAAAVFAMFFVSLGYAYKLIRDRKKIKKFNEKFLRGLLYLILTIPLAFIWAVINQNMSLIAIPIALGAFVIAFKKDILKHYIVKKKKVKDLNEDDVIALEMLSKSTLKKLGLGGRKTFLDSELPEIKKQARKHKIKQVWVSEYLPKFGPYILASLLINLILGDALLWLLFA